MTAVRVLHVLIVALLAILVADLAWFDFSRERLGWRSWLGPQPVLTFAGLIVGFILLSYQLQRQYENTLRTNQQQAQDRLKAELYNEMAKRIEQASHPLVEVGMTPTAVVGEMTIRRQAGHVWPSRYTLEKLQEVSQRASDVLHDLMVVLESHEIVVPEFAVFRRRLSDSSRAIRVAFGDFLNVVPVFLQPAANWPTGQIEHDELSRQADTILRASIEVQAVIHDLRVEAQNHLLGGLFPDHRVPRRIAGNPNFKVTRVEANGDTR